MNGAGEALKLPSTHVITQLPGRARYLWMVRGKRCRFRTPYTDWQTLGFCWATMHACMQKTPLMIVAGVEWLVFLLANCGRADYRAPLRFVGHRKRVQTA